MALHCGGSEDRANKEVRKEGSGSVARVLDGEGNGMRSWNHGFERSLGRREGWGCEADRFIMYGWMD
jgi:hypothetical protein